MTIVTGKKLQVKVDEKQQRVIFCRYSQCRSAFLKFNTLSADKFGGIAGALIHAKTYIKTVEELKDGELKIETTA